MRPGLSLALFAAAALSLSAHASTVYPVSVTGTDSSNNPFSIDFSLDPTMATSAFPAFFEFDSVMGSVNGVKDTFTVDVSDGALGDTLEVSDASSLDEFFSISSNAGVNFLDGESVPPTLNGGTYSGIDYTSCLASLAFPHSGLPATMAMFQVPSLTVDCGAAVSLNVIDPNAPSSVTPEPTSLALFATGALGIAGIVRRRFHA